MRLLMLILVLTTCSVKPEYIYVARGVQCKEYDKESNTLKECDDATFGEVEIINPISVLKIRIR